uniref:Tc1-like transposase DDE domain-containing protein n=1 Tax=Gadus morhua TaxID=8049 RepID=A0A8C5A5Q1_GADMO
MEWPASSPDLNPIQNLWDQLGRAVRARVTNTTTLADLRQMLVEVWDAIPQQCVTRLVTSMRWSCPAVLMPKSIVNIMFH